MFRRLLAALLVAALVAPVPAMAKSNCSMNEPWLSSAVCDCCKTATPATAGASCGASAAVQSTCDCSLSAASGSQPGSDTVAPSPTAGVFTDSTLIPASLSTPRRSIRAVDLAASPPGAGAVVSRPTLCTWIL